MDPCNSCLPPTSIGNQQIDSFFVSVWVYRATWEFIYYFGWAFNRGRFQFTCRQALWSWRKPIWGLLYTFDLTEHVRESTHTHGHSLDLVITRSNETTVFDTSVTDLETPDHYAIVLKISLEKPAFPKTIVHRQWKKINITDLINDLASSNLAVNAESDMHIVVQQFHHGLMNLIDKHAPLRERVVTVRPKTPWYNLVQIVQWYKLTRLNECVANWSTNGSKQNHKLTMIILDSNMPW